MVGMSVVKFKIKMLRMAYSNGDGRTRVSRNFHLRKEQDDMIAQLAEENAETKVTVLRAIIDEWRIMKLSERDKYPELAG